MTGAVARGERAFAPRPEYGAGTPAKASEARVESIALRREVLAMNAPTSREMCTTGVATAPDPLAGLDSLRAVALVGYAQLVEATATPLAYVWQGIIATSDLVEISGPISAGKTTLATLLVAAMANPTAKPVEVLGRMVTPAPHGKFVVVLEEENGEHSMRRKMETACAILGLPARETIDRCMFVIRKGTKAGDAVWRDVETLGRGGAVAAVFVDSRARILRAAGGKANDEDDQAEIADKLFAMIGACCAPVVVLSHVRKDGGSAIDDVAGSVQRAAASDVVLIVKPIANKATSRVVAATVQFVKARDDDKAPFTPVTYSIGHDGEGRPSIKVATTGGPRGGVDEGPTDRDRPLAERVLELLDRPMTRTAIATTLSRSHGEVEKCLEGLVTAGLASMAPGTVNGREFPTYERTTARREPSDERPTPSTDAGPPDTIRPSRVRPISTVKKAT